MVLLADNSHEKWKRNNASTAQHCGFTDTDDDHFGVSAIVRNKIRIKYRLPLNVCWHSSWSHNSSHQSASQPAAAVSTIVDKGANERVYYAKEIALKKHFRTRATNIVDNKMIGLKTPWTMWTEYWLTPVYRVWTLVDVIDSISFLRLKMEMWLTQCGIDQCGRWRVMYVDVFERICSIIVEMWTTNRAHEQSHFWICLFFIFVIFSQQWEDTQQSDLTLMTWIIIPSFEMHRRCAASSHTRCVCACVCAHWMLYRASVVRDRRTFCFYSFSSYRTIKQRMKTK